MEMTYRAAKIQTVEELVVILVIMEMTYRVCNLYTRSFSVVILVIMEMTYRRKLCRFVRVSL